MKASRALITESLSYSIVTMLCMDIISAYQAQAGSLSILELGIYLLLGTLIKILVRTAGPAVLHGKYLKSVSDFTYSNESRLNISYRILAPVVYSYLFVTVVNLALTILQVSNLTNLVWLPIALYWLLQSITVLGARIIDYPKWTLLVQALLSISVGILFDWFVFREFRTSGISSLEETNIGWQFLLIIFFGGSGWVLSGFAKGNAVYEHLVSDNPITDDGSAPELLLRFDAKHEKKLYSLQRRFHDLLPTNFNEDPLLCSLFYSIMYLEDTNRPAWRRKIERLLFVTRQVKTTGIMQVQSEKYLSDNESVRKAVPIIEDIWLEFLEEATLASHATLQISPDAYGYSFEDLFKEYVSRSNLLYGRYCGTMKYHVATTFVAVADFVVYSRHFQAPIEVWVTSKYFSKYSKLIPNRVIRGTNGDLYAGHGVLDENTSEITLRCLDRLTTRNLRDVLFTLEELGWDIHRVSLPGDPFHEISVRTQQQLDIEQIREQFPNWTIVRKW